MNYDSCNSIFSTGQSTNQFDHQDDANFCLVKQDSISKFSHQDSSSEDNEALFAPAVSSQNNYNTNYVFNNSYQQQQQQVQYNNYTNEYNNLIYGNNYNYNNNNPIYFNNNNNNQNNYIVHQEQQNENQSSFIKNSIFDEIEEENQENDNSFELYINENQQFTQIYNQSISDVDLQEPFPSTEYPQINQPEQEQPQISQTNIQQAPQPRRQRKTIQKPKKQKVKKINKQGACSCEETKNLFILVIPFIQKQLVSYYPEMMDLPSFSESNNKSLKYFNELMVDYINQQYDQNKIQQFKETCQSIIQCDLIKYAINHNNIQTLSYVFKYIIGFQVIAQNPGRFVSIKEAKIFGQKHFSQ